MQWLTRLFSWLAGPFTSLPPQRRRRILFWAGQVVLVVVAVVVLALVNNWTGLDRVLRTRALGLNHAWLPLVFLVGYVLFWLIVWLWRLLGPLSLRRRLPSRSPGAWPSGV